MYIVQRTEPARLQCWINHIQLKTFKCAVNCYHSFAEIQWHVTANSSLNSTHNKLIVTLVTVILTNNVFCARQQQCWCMSLLYKLSSLIFTLWYGIKMSEEQFLKMAIVTKMWTVDYDWQPVLSRIFRSYGTQKTLANTSVSLLQSIILYKSETWTIKEQKWKLKAFEKKSAELQEAIVDVMWIYWRSFRWKRISIKY